MKYLELKEKVKTNIFTFLDVVKIFPDEKRQTIKIQLHRLAKKGLIKKIKKGVYCFEKEIDEFVLASLLYQPSYISLESSLNYYGIIPDVPQAITSISPITTKTMTNEFGRFCYAKIKPALFFGFSKVKSTNSFFFNMAKKEKALLDYFYLRKIRKIADLRLDLKEINTALYGQYAQIYPGWVQKIRLKNI